MRRISVTVAIVISVASLNLGLYLLDDLNKTANESVFLVSAAVCLALSLITVIAAVRSMLWHRYMRKHATPHYRQVKFR